MGKVATESLVIFTSFSSAELLQNEQAFIFHEKLQKSCKHAPDESPMGL